MRDGKLLNVSGLLLVCLLVFPAAAPAAVMNDYCILPPFVSAAVPPLVMFETGRDHKLYYEAYNDSADLDDDGRIDYTYKHSIDYYGYFDPYKCYRYDTTGTPQFVPVRRTTDKFCPSTGGEWSGNILNWMTMSRMDVLKKVLYGGHRSTDNTTTTVLERVHIPQDAHSWGKEFTGRLCYSAISSPPYTYACATNADCETGYACTDKSMELVGFSQAGLTTCTAATPLTVNDKILVVRYRHPAGLTPAQTEGGSHTDLLASFSSATEPLSSTFIDYNTTLAGFGVAGSIIDPAAGHLDGYSTMVVAEFKPTANGTWQFMVDSDDGSEVEVLTTAGVSLGIVASYYGAHPSCTTAPTTPCPGMVTGSLPVTKNTWYRLVARVSESAGEDGVRVWYNTGTGWKLFNVGNLGSKNLRTFNVSSSNQCTLYATEFITTGKPTSGAVSQDFSRFHLVCNTSLSSTGAPVMRLLKNVAGKRIWDWASKERPVCDTSLGTPTDYEVRVKVCDSSVDGVDDLDIKKNEVGDSCKRYPPDTGTTWKPVGLLQQYGEGDGTKVCSKSMSKTCNSDSDCSFATEGLCINKADMYFGMFSTSYEKNLSGGVLRKNIGSILDESNANNGIFQSSENAQGNIILTFDRLKIVGFRYSSYSYEDTTGGSCGWITTRPLNEGECRNWGNPIAEMMYESLRYFAGKLTPTSAFTYSTTQDSGLQLSKPDWGYKVGSTAYPPYDIYPACSKPFVLLLSDVNTSYDSDQIPGTPFSSFTEDAASPQLGLGSSVASGRTLLQELAHTIGTTEGINGDYWFTGENGTVADFICTSKYVTSLGSARGICPEEPTKQGSYYSAAVAYYGRSFFKAKTGKPDVNTFAVALSSPFSELSIKTPTGTVSLLPTAKSVSGCLSAYSACAARMNLSVDATYGLRIQAKTPADTSAYCPTNSIVDYYVDDIRYDTSGNVIYALFRINYEDVEQGADHDMDAIVRYEICTATAATNSYGSCGATDLTVDQFEIKLFSDYAAGCIDQVMGFVVSGTTEDGVYLPVRDRDVSVADTDTPSAVANLPLVWSKVFTVSSTGARTLKNPLWYAAKWGGFVDTNGNNIPDLKDEWASECALDASRCNPDNYYPVVNPLRLRQQLNKALSDIMRRVSSGTAASILNNSEGSGANLLQAVFYPVKSFENNTEAKWVGELHNLWYYLDPYLQNTSIREDSGGSSRDFTLNLKTDRIAKFFFDSGNNKTLVNRFADDNGDGLADSTSPVDTVEPDAVSSIWRAGELLHKRSLTSSPRTILTNVPGGPLYTFPGASADSNMVSLVTSNATLLRPYLGAATDADAQNIISYVHGVDNPGGTTTRSRTVTYKGVTGTWKLGDIVSSTPKLVATTKLNNYDLSAPTGYADASYSEFVKQSPYTQRGMVFVGANDGMLHAFRLGILKEMNDPFNKAKIVNPDGSTATLSSGLGEEAWAYVPKQALPYLQYLRQPDYNHIYYVDRTPTIADMSIAKPASCGSSDYSLCPRTTESWRTVLIGGMGIGGAARAATDSCASSTCVKSPLTVTEGGATTSVGFSSYFALDVTDPEKPRLLWEFGADAVTGKFTPGELGYSTTGPAIVRVGDPASNGRWFAIFGSGPTGPIDTTTHEFKGQSNQNLKLFVVDIGTGELVRTITSFHDGSPLPSNAFAGTLSSSWVDLDRYKTGLAGNYSDDVVYVGYTRQDAASGTWTKGGVLRLNTKESTNPDDWEVSSLISDAGPVTTSVTKLQDRKNGTLWVYFGTGRYFYKNDDNRTGVSMRIYGVKEPCYSTANRQDHTPYMNVAGGTVNDLDIACRDSVTDTFANPLVDQTGTTTTSPAATIATTAPGWFVNLEQAGSGSLMERVITDPVASPSGAVFFTTFKPKGDICSFGGDSLIWALKYDTGGEPPVAAMKGKALLQVSTGAFAEITLSEAFRGQSDKRFDMRRLATPISGVPPAAQGLSIFGNPKPVKRILHVREK